MSALGQDRPIEAIDVESASPRKRTFRRDALGDATAISDTFQRTLTHPAS
jgi:hypothetical protein